MVQQDSLIHSHDALLIGLSILSWLHAKQNSQQSFEQVYMWQVDSTGPPNGAADVGKWDEIHLTCCSSLYVILHIRIRDIFANRASFV